MSRLLRIAAADYRSKQSTCLVFVSLATSTGHVTLTDSISMKGSTPTVRSLEGRVLGSVLESEINFLISKRRQLVLSKHGFSVRLRDIVPRKMLTCTEENVFTDPLTKGTREESYQQL